MFVMFLLLQLMVRMDHYVVRILDEAYPISVVVGNIIVFELFQELSTLFIGSEGGDADLTDRVDLVVHQFDH